MATRSPYKRQTKRSMIQSLPASSASSRRRFISRKRIAMMIPLALFSGAVFLFFMPFNSWGQSSNSLDLSHRIHEIEIVAEFPHDPDAFTQGLLYAGNDTLFESTGLYGKSSVRKVDLRTGKVKPFKHHMKDGWGLATDGEVLFGSDGTSTLYRMDPRTMKVTNKHTVRYNGYEVRYLNELEYINKEVWANVWQSDCIARISPKDGSLLGWILLPKLRQGLLKSGHGGIDVLNGIAWDSDKQRLFVTGKLWPKLYQIKLKPASAKSGIYIEQQCLV
ncbi:Glutaminyl-peptide cyclotransferase [Arabidopsis suecica]|uniref:Glutaminyl-peptide cyclotransferase n=1 Tax=Arabidopsis suecica TaxID=45249 RepID=A0A8T1YJH6_ARASU|nr:Glutaminyl-peptide cyclotransferase [Arabidopsis suecica]